MARIVRITSQREGFRRGGLVHPKRATDYPREQLTDAQLKLLKAEPVLTVTELDSEEASTAETTKGKRK